MGGELDLCGLAVSIVFAARVEVEASVFWEGRCEVETWFTTVVVAVRRPFRFVSIVCTVFLAGDPSVGLFFPLLLSGIVEGRKNEQV